MQTLIWWSRLMIEMCKIIQVYQLANWYERQIMYGGWFKKKEDVMWWIYWKYLSVCTVRVLLVDILNLFIFLFCFKSAVSLWRVNNFKLGMVAELSKVLVVVPWSIILVWFTLALGTYLLRFISWAFMSYFHLYISLGWHMCL